MRFQDRVVIVTGGSKGIGAGCSRVFCREGGSVAILARGLEAGSTPALRRSRPRLLTLVNKATLTTGSYGASSEGASRCPPLRRRRARAARASPSTTGPAGGAPDSVA